MHTRLPHQRCWKTPAELDNALHTCPGTHGLSPNMWNKMKCGWICSQSLGQITRPMVFVYIDSLSISFFLWKPLKKHMKEGHEKHGFIQATRNKVHMPSTSLRSSTCRALPAPWLPFVRAPPRCVSRTRPTECRHRANTKRSRDTCML